MREILSRMADEITQDESLRSLSEICAKGLRGLDAVMDQLRDFQPGDIALLQEVSLELSKNLLSPGSFPAVAEVEDKTALFEKLSRIEKNLDHLSRELVLAETGSDQGQLPIREIFSNLISASEGEGALAKISASAQEGLGKMDEILDALRPFTGDDLRFFVKKLETLNILRREVTFGAMSQPLPQEELAVNSSSTETLPPLDDCSAPQETPAPAPVAAPVTSEPAGSGEEPSIQLALIEDRDLLGEFINEAIEHLENIEQGVLQLEENPASIETINTVFRSYHTLKGGSGFLNLKPINGLAHQLESLLDLARQKKLEITRDIISLILEGGDVIRRFVQGMQSQLAGKTPLEPLAFPTLQLIVRVKAMAQGKPIPKEVPVTPVAVSSNGVADVASTPSSEAKAAPASDHPGVKHGVVASVVKVDTHKLDALFDMVGEMVIAQSLIAQDPDLLEIRSQRLIRNLAQLSRITNELQKTAMSIRMVPIRATFQKMQRVIRDIAGKVNKQVDLKMLGEETELDRTIVEEISDPLIHMIRNAVDHGIESVEKRVAAGKSPHGTVTLNAFHQGGSIVIQISDDGGGLNKDRILAKAVEKKIITPADELSDKEIFNLIFAPGFSTAEQVTDISGRGVGMDVVLRNIEKLRGKVEIESTPGHGSTFSIALPLTLAIIEGLVVRIGDHRYILPTLAVRESFRPTSDMLSTVYRKGEMVNVRGSLLPMLRLGKVFQIGSEDQNPTDAIVVVVEAGHQQRAVLVNELIGKQEVVIKSLGAQFKRNHYLSGAAILGDGTVGLILDPATLVNGPSGN